jgi:hypothetical protein
LKRCRTLDVNIFLCFGFFVWICLFIFFAKKGANPTVDGEKKDDPPTPSDQRARTLRKRKTRKIRVQRRQKKHKKQLMGQRIMLMQNLMKILLL